MRLFRRSNSIKWSASSRWPLSLFCTIHDLDQMTTGKTHLTLYSTGCSSGFTIEKALKPIEVEYTTLYLNITVSFWCVFKEVSDWLVLPMCRLFLAISVILKSHGNKLNNWFLSSSIIQWYIFSRNLRFFLNSPFSRSTSNESKLLNKAGGKYKKAQLTRLNNSSPKNNQYHQEQ